MTRTIVLGEDEQTQKKAIIFSEALTLNKIIEQCYTGPTDWKNIELICRNYGGLEIDLMFAYDDDRNDGTLFLGNWNDGIVA